MGMYGRTRNILFCAWVALAFLTGCTASHRQAGEVDEDALLVSDVTVADAMSAAEDVLTRMHFTVDKADPERGLMTTRPLSGAQFIEFWRSDNVGLARALEANVHTLRRSVELQFRPAASRLAVNCTVKVQRFSLPENEVVSVSRAYRMHSQSTSTIQRLELEPWQREGLAWIDLGDDPMLARRILRRIARKIQGQEKDETQ